MEPFRTHSGLVVPLDRANVDTDQIVPKQFLKRIGRTGFGEVLFYDWRYLPDGSPDPEFVLNRPEYSGATVLVAGANFGCGSSREHAPWALREHGFRAIIATSFADIFQSNCYQNSILPVSLDGALVAEITARASAGTGYSLTVDLESLTVTDASGLRAALQVDPFRRECLLAGLDDIELTVRHERAISDYEARRPDWMPVVMGGV